MRGDSLGICGWIKNSFIDFPGAVSTVLFFAGCNLRCPWCHNPDIVKNLPGPLSFEEILQHIEKRRGILDGAVLTGGEPTLHKSLPEVIEALRKETLKVKIDTNGLNPDMINLCEPDYLALDIKTDPSRYLEIGCRVAEPEKLLSRSVNIVKTMGERAEIRITVVPEFITEQSIRTIARLIEGVSTVYLQLYNNRVELLDNEFAEMAPVAIDQVKVFKDIVTPFVGNCRIRGEYINKPD